ncbi:hypothetical protein CSC17_5897 (plasmid) [Klebsiella oxytoca]|nr:hypothetical protein CSC17_5897 [Klebsiella oxytoca]
MSAFHAAFGRAGIRADSMDIQLMHRTPKLGISIAPVAFLFFILNTLAVSLYTASGLPCFSR